MSIRQRRALAVERRQQAWGLYIAGRTQQEIATVLGVTRSAVGKMIDLAQKTTIAKMEDVVRTVKVRDINRLDYIIREGLRAWDQSKRGGVKKALKSGEDGNTVTVTKQRSYGEPRYLGVAVEAMERQARLLGLDAPAKAITVAYERPLKDLSEEDLRRELAEINRQVGITSDDVAPRIH
jgi:hypothetical protein